YSLPLLSAIQIALLIIKLINSHLNIHSFPTRRSSDLEELRVALLPSKAQKSLSLRRSTGISSENHTSHSFFSSGYFLAYLLNSSFHSFCASAPRRAASTVCS